MTIVQRIWPYGIALGTTAIALGLTLTLEPWLMGAIGTFFYGAVFLSDRYGGRLPGLLAIASSTAAVTYFILPPRQQFWLSQPEDGVVLLSFVGVALLVYGLRRSPSGHLPVDRALIANSGAASDRPTSDRPTSASALEPPPPAIQSDAAILPRLDTADRSVLCANSGAALKSALNASQIGLWDWDLLTRQIIWSSEHEQIFGFAPGTFDGRYETFLSCLHGDDRDQVEQAVARSLEQHIPYQCEFRVCWPDGSIHWIEERGHGFYDAMGTPIRMTGSVIIIDERKRSEAERKQVQDLLQQQIEQQRMVMDTTQRIRRSLNLEDILQTTANEIRQLLQTDRVIIFQFDAHWVGTVVVESCGADWLPILSTKIVEPCFAEHYIQPFKDGLVTGKSNIYTAGIAPCHLHLLSQFQVRANLVVPVLKNNELWGLLIAHHCVGPREWHPPEIDLLRQIAAQLGIAIQQSDLYAQVQTKLLERQQIEAALRQSEQRYRSLVMASAQMVWLADSNGYTTTTSSSGLEILGKTLEEYQGWGWLDAVHPDDRDRTAQIWKAAYTHHTLYETEYRLRLKEGRYHYFAVRGVPIVDEAGEIVEWIGTCTDITERKQAEEALRQAKAELETRVEERTAELTEVNNRLLNALVYRQEIETALRQSEEKFRQLAENIKAVFWIVEYATQQVLYVSPAYATLWQRNPDSLYLNPLDWLEAVHPDDRPRLQSLTSEIMNVGQYDASYRIIRPDGSIRWIRDRAFPIKNEAGLIVRIAGIAEDITEQQKLEQIKNEFISIVSHELRTPLASIQLSLGLLKAGVYDNKPDKFKRMLEIALIDTRRLVSLVNDILDLERLEAGRTILEKSYCQATDLMQQSASSLQTIANQSQVTITILPTDIEIYASAEAIVQTLTNLLSNAIKFSPPHSVVTLQVEGRDRDILFTVSDQGRGIPADKLKTIFGRFQQVDASDAREKGGTGLGLAICQSIVEQHSGQIWVESKLGLGSTFFVSLPRPSQI